MPVSRESVHDQQLIRYLVGLLPDDEAEPLDEQSIVDDETAARLRCLENDLVDDHVSGKLEGEIPGGCGGPCLASPHRGDKVTFAQRLAPAVGRLAAAGGGASPVRVAVVDPVRHRSAGESRGWRAPRSRFVWALATAAVLLLTVGVLFFQEVRLRRDIGDAERASLALQARAQALAGQLDEQRAANLTIMQAPNPARALHPIA